jgi:hypothetical protein
MLTRLPGTSVAPSFAPAMLPKSTISLMASLPLGTTAPPLVPCLATTGATRLVGTG